MPRLPVPGQDSGIWGNLLNEFLSVDHNADGTIKASGTIASKADDASVVHLSGAETIAGAKTFSTSPVVPAPTTATHAATKDYVDTAITGATAPDATTTTKGIVQLAGDLAGTATSPTVPGLSGKANDSSVVHLSGTETITGTKTFSASPIVPTPTNGTHATTKAYVDSAITGAATPDATTSTKGIVQLAGDLAGTAASPTVPGLSGKVDKSTLTTKGDLYAATAASTVTRLGIGTDTQILTADSTQASGMKWATPTVDFQGNGFIGFGDSISSVTGGAGYGASWTLMAPALSDQRLNYLANAGISGNNTTQMLARITTDVLAYGPQVCTVLGGTNDLAQSVTFTTYKSNITSIVTQLRDARILPVLCTIPPRGNTTYLANTIKWNNWLRTYARQQSLPLIDFFTLLVDPATGMFLSGYDSGDALHPSQAAHIEMAKLVNSKLVPYVPPYSPPRAVSNTGDTDNLISNPFMLTGSPTPTGYVAAGTGGMTGVTEQLVTDGDFLGNAWEWNFTNPSNAAGFRQITQTLTGGTWSVGDTLLFVMKSKVVSKSGVTPGSSVGVRMSASFFSSATPTVVFAPGSATVHPAGLYWFKYVVPASTTSVAINGGMFSIPTTGQLTARVGEFAVFNLTTLTLT
ncbi:MAG TPA: GDSL-type esterase/lipase family protein [Candidatus Saccharimonadales bacterium]